MKIYNDMKYTEMHNKLKINLLIIQVLIWKSLEHSLIQNSIFYFFTCFIHMMNSRLCENMYDNKKYAIVR